jgi:hypothetical protein
MRLFRYDARLRTELERDGSAPAGRLDANAMMVNLAESVAIGLTDMIAAATLHPVSCALLPASRDLARDSARGCVWWLSGGSSAPGACGSCGAY